MSQLVVNAAQAPALAEYLRRYGGGDDLVITAQGDGSVVLSGGLAETWEVTSAGTVFTESGEEVVT